MRSSATLKRAHTNASGRLLIGACVVLVACGTTQSQPPGADATDTAASGAGGAGGSAAGMGATSAGSGGTGPTSAGAGGAGITITTGAGGSEAQQCAFQRSQAATCMSQMPFVDIAIDGKNIHYDQACGPSDCPTNPWSAHGEDGGPPFDFTLCNASQPDMSGRVRVVNGDHFIWVHVCQDAANCQYYLPIDSVVVSRTDRFRFSVQTQVRQGSYQPAPGGGTSLEPIDGGPELALVLSVTECL